MKLLTRLTTATAALACLTLATPALGSTASAETAAAARSSSSAAVPACHNRDLKVSFKYTGSAAGHAYGKIRIRNVSGHKCRTGGYGGVSYVGHGNGTQIGHAAIRDGGKARSFVLKPGKRLVSRLTMTNAQNYDRSECRPTKVDGLRVYVPNAYKSQYVAYRTVGCAKKKAHLLYQLPYRRP